MKECMQTDSNSCQFALVRNRETGNRQPQTADRPAQPAVRTDQLYQRADHQTAGRPGATQSKASRARLPKIGGFTKGRTWSQANSQIEGKDVSCTKYH